MTEELGKDNFHTTTYHKANEDTALIRINPEYIDREAPNSFIVDDFKIDDFPLLKRGISAVIGERPDVKGMDPEEAAETIVEVQEYSDLSDVSIDELSRQPIELRHLVASILDNPELTART